jgi:CheY-like chemotaxis protein/DNA-binding MarR family transcriptional regulator
VSNAVPRKVLLVDDDPASLALVEAILSDVGFATVTAGSGAEALRLLEADREVAVIVSDVVMPGLDGVRLARFVRERFPERPWLQVLFITAHAELELAVSALRLGAVDYLTKPVPPDELVWAVSRALAASRAIVRSLPTAPPDGEDASAIAAEDAGRITSALDYIEAVRRLRRQSQELADLDEASWGILLEVYRADITGRRLSVSKLCATDEASQTTAWRRIRTMESDGLLVRDLDPTDARRSFVSLTERAARAVSAFMARADRLLNDSKPA